MRRLVGGQEDSVNSFFPYHQCFTSTGRMHATWRAAEGRAGSSSPLRDASAVLPLCGTAETFPCHSGREKKRRREERRSGHSPLPTSNVSPGQRRPSPPNQPNNLSLDLILLSLVLLRDDAKGGRGRGWHVRVCAGRADNGVS